MFILRPEDKHCFTSQSEDVTLVSISVQRDEFENIAVMYGKKILNQIITGTSPVFLKNCSLLNYSLFDYEKMANNLNDYDYKFLISTILHYYTQNIELKSVVPASLYFAVNEMKKQENLQQGIKVFLNLSNYSQTHLARLMKKYYNTTPKRYVNELRLQNAYDNIVLTQNPFELISEQLGFSSYSHFNKIFKERFSVTPAALRKQKTVWTV